MKDTRIRNWSKYNNSLVQRGSITLWIDESAWCAPDKTRIKGRPRHYSHALIEAALTLKHIFHLTFRSLQGFLGSISSLMGKKLAIPNYTTICRRQHNFSLPLLSRRKDNLPMDIVVDSTGLKIYGEGEWCASKHGMQRLRTWRKIHLAVNANDLQIVGCKLTHSRIQDGTPLNELIDMVPGEIRQIIGDGAYDKFHCYEVAHRRGSKGIFPPQTGARLSLETPHHRKAASQSAIRQRDQAIEGVRKHGRKEWKERIGYHKRSLAETTMYRLKKILGERLSAKLEENQHLELLLRCNILNKLSSIG